MWKIAEELGAATILHAPRDVHLLFLTRFLRMAAYGAASLILALFFSSLGISEPRIGLFMTFTLLGDVGLSLLLTFIADAAGRRRILLLGCCCMVLAGSVFALSSSYWALLFAAVVGVISVSGAEIGPFRAVEESVLAGLVDEHQRSDVFAWYVVLGTLGSAVGLSGAGWTVEILGARNWTELDAYRVVFWEYAVVGVAKALVTTLLSANCEVGEEEGKKKQSGSDRTTPSPIGATETTGLLQASMAPHVDGEEEGDEPTSTPATNPKLKFAQLSTETRWISLRLCALFAIDSLASGMAPYSLINFYLDRKFHTSKSTLGAIMSAVWIMSTIGNIFASAISKRIGLIRTMVFTHLPSAVFLALLPAPRGIWLTVVLLVLRGTLASMDQAPRSAFLSKAVASQERTAVMGLVNVVKTLSQSGGPTVTGVLAGANHFWVAFVVAGSLKATYDLGLMTCFLEAEKQAANKPDVEYREEPQRQPHANRQ